MKAPLVSDDQTDEWHRNLHVKTKLPVPLKVYDETIRVMKSGIEKAKLGRDETLQALQRLDAQARRLEAVASGPSLEAHIQKERAASPSHEGRSVFGWEKDLGAKTRRLGGGG